MVVLLRGALGGGGVGAAAWCGGVCARAPRSFARAHLHTLQQLCSLAELAQLRLLADLLHRAPVDERLEGEREDHRLQHRGHLRPGLAVPVRRPHRCQ